MGIRIDGASDLINATDGSLTIEGQSVNTTGIITASGGVKVGSAATIHSTGQFNIGVAATIFANGNATFSGIATVGSNVNVGNNLQVGVAGTTITTTNAGTASSVGIGTAAPTQKLHLSSPTGDVYLHVDTNVNGGMILHYQGNQRGLVANDSAFSGNATDFTFAAKNNLVMRAGSSYAHIAKLTADGKFLMGNGSTYGSGEMQIFHDSQYLLDVSTFSADANGPIQSFYKSRNATIGSATIVQDGDSLGKIRFLGNDGANSRTAVEITSEVDGTPGTNDMPGRLLIRTTTDGGQTTYDALTITNAGKMHTNYGTQDLGEFVIRPRANDATAILALQRFDSNGAMENGEIMGQVDFCGNDNNYISGVTSCRASIRGVAQNTSSAARMEFHVGHNLTGLAEAMRIIADRSIYIGTTTQVSGGGSGGVDGAEFYAGNASELRCGINGTGNSTQIRFYNGNGEVGAIRTNASATTYNTSSDYRLKENAAAITDGIVRVKTLKPYRFNFKSDAGKTVDGFFAHEVTAVPEAISGTKDQVATADDVKVGNGTTVGDPLYQSIDQSKLVPLLTAALQEAIAKIETLETKVAALESA